MDGAQDALKVGHVQDGIRQDSYARAHIRVIVKRILRRYGYPPDKQEKATLTVLEQAEVLCKDWSSIAA